MFRYASNQEGSGTVGCILLRNGEIIAKNYASEDQRKIRKQAGVSLPGPVFPATASAEGAQLNGRPSPRQADRSAAAVRARPRAGGWCDGLTARGRGTTGPPFHRRSQ